MKKNTLFKIAAGVLAAITLTLGVIAATNSKTIEVIYHNIKIMIDGAEYVPTDVNGNVVEPFIYNGTTYLPVRAVANAFGKDVKWDGKNWTVYLGKEGRMEPDNRLDKLQYMDYREGDRDNWLSLVTSIQDYNGKLYTNGLLFCIYGEDILDEGAQTAIDYPLNGQYEDLTGKIVLPKSFEIPTETNNECRTTQSEVIILGDGQELYHAKGLTASMPFDFKIDVQGVTKLTIQINADNDWGFEDSYIALTDLALYE